MDPAEQLKAYEQIAAKAARAKLLRYHNHGVIIITLPTPPAPNESARRPEATAQPAGSGQPE